jgi:hypothetical protein
MPVNIRTSISLFSGLAVFGYPVTAPLFVRVPGEDTQHPEELMCRTQETFQMK